MKKDIFRQIGVIISFVYMLAVNSLANILPLNNISTGNISNSFNAVFVPAGYVFAIWGLIYIALLGVTVYHSLPAKRADNKMRAIGWWLALSNILNGTWIFFWHYGHNNLLFIGTLVIMLGLFSTLMNIYLTLDIGRMKFNIAEKWLVAIPFSIYLGWISIATIANITDLLIFLHWNGFNVSADLWAMGLLAAGLVISFLMTILRKDAAFLLVFVWAFTGIGINWLTSNEHARVRLAAFIAAGMIALFTVYALIPAKPKKAIKYK